MPLRATQCVDHCKCYIVKRLRASRSEIEDARFAWVIKEPKIDSHYIVYKDEVALLITSLVATIFAK